MSQPINPKLWDKTAPLGRIDDYDKVLPILEVYRCVQSEGSLGLDDPLLLSVLLAALTAVILVKVVGATVGILQSTLKKVHLRLMTLLKYMMKILTSKK